MRAERPSRDNTVEILIVEDSPTQALQLQHLLEQHGCRASVAKNGLAALAVMGQRKPAIVISDIVMPEMDGYQLCRQIKADEQLKDVPVMLVTTLSDPGDVIRGLECGADAFLIKPYEAPYLLARLQYFLANRHLRQNEKVQMGVEIVFAGQKHFITSDRLQILNLLLSVYESAMQKNQELSKARDAMKQLNEQLESLVAERTAVLRVEITERERAEEALRRAHDELELRVKQRTVELAAANEALQTEVVERKQIEQALRTSEERHRMVSELSSDYAYAFRIEPDQTLALEWVTGAFTRITGYTPEELDERGWDILYYPDDVASFEQRSARLASGQPDTRDLRVVTKNGDVRWLHVSTRPVWDEAQDRVVRFYGATQDITERKEVERLKDELVSTASHELRTPLASLRGFAELMLKRDFPPEKQREFLTIIHDESVRLGNLISDFFDLQRMEAGRQVYHFDSVDVTPLLRERVSLFFGSPGKHLLHLAIPDSLPPVRADADRVRQVLTNLLSNAVKFSPQGGTVTVGARQEGTQVVVWVADQGVGIPPEALPKLFSRFFRVDNTATRSIGGTGLGLALVKEIVEAHKGQVWAESELGKGSTFFFTLPIRDYLPW